MLTVSLIRLLLSDILVANGISLIDQKAIETLLNLVEKYGQHGRDVSQQGTGTVKDVRGNENVRVVETNLRVSVDLFALQSRI